MEWIGIEYQGSEERILGRGGRVMDALKAFKKYVGTSLSESFITLLYNDGWRLDLVQDGRCEAYTKPKYTFTNFIDKSSEHQNLATEAIPLEDDEVYGFLKARFPEKDFRSEIKKKVQDWLKKEIIDAIE